MCSFILYTNQTATKRMDMAFSAILLVFENSHVFVLQVCKLIDL